MDVSPPARSKRPRRRRKQSTNTRWRLDEYGRRGRGGRPAAPFAGNRRKWDAAMSVDRMSNNVPQLFAGVYTESTSDGMQIGEGRARLSWIVSPFPLQSHDY